MVHEAFDAMSLVSNPSISIVLIRIRCAASSCGAMVGAGTKVPTLSGMEKEEEGWEERWGADGPKAPPDEAGGD